MCLNAWSSHNWRKFRFPLGWECSQFIYPYCIVTVPTQASRRQCLFILTEFASSAYSSIFISSLFIHSPWKSFQGKKNYSNCSSPTGPYIIEEYIMTMIGRETWFKGHTQALASWKARGKWTTILRMNRQKQKRQHLKEDMILKIVFKKKQESLAPFLYRTTYAIPIMTKIPIQLWGGTFVTFLHFTVFLMYILLHFA